MELNKKIEIKVLNIEDPHHFWFRTASDANLIHTKLQTYINQCQNIAEIYVPKIGDGVIAWAYNQYLIARVTQILDENEIVCSILENGHKLKDSIKNFIHLNDTSLVELAINSILIGSLSDIQPAMEVIYRIEIFINSLHFFFKLYNIDFKPKHKNCIVVWK